jgi:hypothetical protein
MKSRLEENEIKERREWKQRMTIGMQGFYLEEN